MVSCVPLAGWNTASVANMSGAFDSAVAFNYNLGSWNVLRVANVTGSFDSTTALEDCYRRGMYTAWGSTLQVAYPLWSSLCSPTPAPSTTTPSTATPSTASPRF